MVSLRSASGVRRHGASELYERNKILYALFTLHVNAFLIFSQCKSVMVFIVCMKKERIMISMINQHASSEVS